MALSRRLKWYWTHAEPIHNEERTDFTKMSFSHWRSGKSNITHLQITLFYFLVCSTMYLSKLFTTQNHVYIQGKEELEWFFFFFLISFNSANRPMFWHHCVFLSLCCSEEHLIQLHTAGRCAENPFSSNHMYFELIPWSYMCSFFRHFLFFFFFFFAVFLLSHIHCWSWMWLTFHQKL